MKVITKIKVYEINGSDDVDKELEIDSHWNMKDRVTLIINGIGYTVLAEDLIKAIKNAQNH